MKKLITIVLALAMILPAVAMADLPDVSGLSDQELKDLIAACSTELRERNTTEPEGILLFEYEGARIYQTGKAEINILGYLQIPVAIYNDSDTNLSIGVDNVVCNGWDIMGIGEGASAHAKKKGDLNFTVDDADVTSVDQIESLRFIWTVTNTDNYRFIYKQQEPEEHRFW